MHHDDRRHDVREPMQCPVKVRCEATGRYVAGRMHNLSAGGALITIEHPSRLTPGAAVALAIAAPPNANVLRAEDMTHAVVVRSMNTADQQYLALRFDDAAQNALAIAA